MKPSLDPGIAEVLPKLPPWNVSTLTPDGARALLRALAEARKDLPLPQPRSIEERVVAGGVPVRIYRGATGPAPTVVFFHGGGWVAGDLDTHDRTARWLAVDLGAVVVSAFYRRPPEAPFPAAFDDALAVTRWAGAAAAELGGDAARLGVAGDSAGGNLAAAVALACRDGGPRLAAQLLVYPVVDCAGGFRDEAGNRAFASRHENADGYFLTLEVMQWFTDHYFADRAAQSDPRASPLRAADLSGVAPAVVCTAHFDPLRDEGIAYARRLRESGVPVVEHRGAGLIHGYFGMGDSVPAAGDECRRVRADFRALLAARGG